MSETKFTWEVGETYKDSTHPAGVTEITDGSGYVVASIPMHMGSSRSARRAAFPALIAAAPDLYVALKNLLIIVEVGIDTGTFELAGSLAAYPADARAALAKAVQP